MLHSDVTIFSPILYSKISNVQMSCTFCKKVLLLIICRADMLSICIGVGDFCSYPNCFKTILRYFVIFAAMWAAINSALVELPAVKDWVLNLYTLAPPQNVKTNPVVDRCFLNLLACAASTKPVRIGQLILTSKFDC